MFLGHWKIDKRKQSFKEKTTNIYKKHVEKRIKKKFKKIKDTWQQYKESNAKRKIGGLGLFLVLLTAGLVVLRILEVIMWSWIWVFAPLWIPLILAIILLALLLIGLASLKN